MELEFREACLRGQRAKARHLVKCGVKNIIEGLCVACQYGHLSVVKDLLENKSKDGYSTALYVACCYNQTIIFNYLFEQDEKFYDHIEDGSIIDSFFAACWAGNMRMVNKLYNICNDSANVVDQGLIAACQGGHLAVINKLISYGAKTIPKGFVAASSQGHLPVLLRLMKTGEISKHTETDTYKSAFCTACECDQLPVVQYLAEWNPSLEIINKGLVHACSEGHMDIVCWLIQNQHANALNEGLWASCSAGHVNVTRCLIDYGANKLNDALHVACTNGHLNQVKYLIQCGAKDVNYAMRAACLWPAWIIDEDISTLAASVKQDIVQHQTQCIDYLVQQCGANDFNGGLRSSCFYGRLEMVTLMLRYGATAFNEGLYMACRGNNLNCIQKMIQCGATLPDEFVWKTRDGKGLQTLSDLKQYNANHSSMALDTLRAKTCLSTDELSIVNKYIPWSLPVSSISSKPSPRCILF